MRATSFRRRSISDNTFAALLRVDQEGEQLPFRALDLLGEIVANDSLLGIPTNLSGDEQERATFSQNPVVVAERLAKSFRVDHDHIHRLRRHQFCAASPLYSFRSVDVPSFAKRLTNPIPAT